MPFLEGPYENEIGKAERDVVQIPRNRLRRVEWQARLLRVGRLVWFRQEDNGPLLLAQCISNLNQNNNMIVLLTRNNDGHLETVEARVNDRNCMISNIREDAPLGLLYEPPVGYYCRFPPRAPAQIPFVQDYSNALVNRRTLSEKKFFRTDNFQELAHWSFFARIKPKGVQGVDSDSDADDANEGVLGMIPVDDSSDENHRREEEAEERRDIEGNIRLGGIRMHPRELRQHGLTTNTLFSNIHIILQHWAKYNYSFEGSDEEVWNMEAGELVGQPEDSVRSRLTTQLFTIQRSFLDWLWSVSQRVEQPGTNRVDAAMLEVKYLKFLFNEDAVHSSLNPVTMGCDDIVMRPLLTERARAMVTNGLQQAFRLTFVDGGAFPLSPADERVVRSFLAAYIPRINDPGPRPHQSLVVSCLKGLAGMYLDETVGEIAMKHVTDIIHVAELRPGDLILVNWMLAVVMGVRVEPLTTLELTQMAAPPAVARPPAANAATLFRLNSHVLYYRFHGMTYRTNEWRHVRVLRDLDDLWHTLPR